MASRRSRTQKATLPRQVPFESALVATTPPPPPIAQVRMIGVQADGVQVSNAVSTNAMETEDEFTQYYIGKDTGPAALIPPPYAPKLLDLMLQENNTLGPCIEAMVTNICKTGFEFYKDTGKKAVGANPEDDPKINELWDFFSEPYPGESWETIREKVRRDRLSVGNGYYEAIRNASDEIVYIRHVDAKMVRLVKLDEPVVAEKVLRRKGKDVRIRTLVRERRYCQISGTKKIYFKQFGASRDLNKYTGVWAAKGVRLAAALRATELLHVIDKPDANGPYGVPRWIGQTPSVMGSRKAEEYNNDFFDNGGVPPVMLFVNGGILGSETRKAIETKTGGLAKGKNKVVVVETEPTGGTLDNPGKVSVTVERFGDRQEDAMFEKYDERCEIRVRRGFRLPAIFIGGGGDASLASAYTAITVTEAQVFKPERESDDEVISMQVLPALGYRGYRMRSGNLNIQDTANRLRALQLAIATKHVEASELVREINETAGTNMQVVAQPLEYFDRAPGQAGGLPTKSRLTDADVDKNAGVPAGIDD